MTWAGPHRHTHSLTQGFLCSLLRGSRRDVRATGLKCRVLNVCYHCYLCHAPGLETSSFHSHDWTRLSSFLVTVGSRVFLENLNQRERSLACSEGPISCKEQLFMLPHFSSRGEYSPKGRTRVRLAAGGSVSGGHCSQKSQQEGHRRFPL